MSRKFAFGFFLSFLSAVLWGTVYISSRFLMRGSSIDPVSLSLIRYVGAGSLLFVIGLCTGQKMFGFDRRTLFLMIVQGMIGMAGQSLFIFWGHQTTSALNSSMIMSTIPVMILVAGFFCGKRVAMYQVIGMVVATVGCLLVIRILDGDGIHLDAFSRGDCLVFGAALCWTIYALWGGPTIRRVGGFVYTTYVMLGAVPLLVVLEFFNDMVLPEGTTSWLVVLYLTFFPTAIAFWAWNASQKYIDLSLLNIMQYLTPVTVLVLSYPFLGESSTWLQCVGVLLVIAGVSYDPQMLASLKHHRMRPANRH